MPEVRCPAQMCWRNICEVAALKIPTKRIDDAFEQTKSNSKKTKDSTEPSPNGSNSKNEEYDPKLCVPDSKHDVDKRENPDVYVYTPISTQNTATSPNEVIDLT